MADVIQKRNTDCVYFLASPLTCKKGSECEYRHSESARLNPRDCYYWLNGNCLNPTCAFRHPPLEGFTETVPEPAHLPSSCAVTTSKSNVPCYFYFNAYCIKGDQCPFLHDTLPAQKFAKAGPEITTGQPLENKLSAGSDTGPASVEVPANPPGKTPVHIKLEHSKEVLQQPARGNALEEPSLSVESSVPECEEPAIKFPEETLLPPAGYMNGGPQLCQDQDVSEEIEKECTEPDERWESSPGFDVLVDDGSEQLAYEDDADYLLAREGESDMLQSHLLPYDFEVPAGYDPTAGYADTGYLYDHGAYDNYDPMESRYTPEYFQRDSELSRDRRNVEAMPHRKKKPSRRRREVIDDRADADLRNHLRKRRRIDSDHRMCRSSQGRGISQERPMRHGMGPLLQGRLASEVGKSMIVPSRSESESADLYRRGWSVYPQSSRHVLSRLRDREIRRRHRNPLPTLSSKISQKTPPRRAESARGSSATFSGPKTLAQIKEEKRRAREATGNSSEGYIFEHSKRSKRGDFEGPKPLNELLKHKRSAPSNGNSDTLAETDSKQDFSGYQVEKRLSSNVVSEGANELSYHGTREKQDTGYDSEFMDDDDDDDDALRKKLARIFSS